MKVIAVYLCGDDLPSALFVGNNAIDNAEEFPQYQPQWMDKTIKELEIPDDFFE
jgi:hypothetical protein